ncbi:MAG: substrate-binding domain-containing protein, partial [Marinosulfonomonas sp.]|nr:substrate-binding domain-containing protein [Marinosulfonomonas sp.]
RDGKVSVSGTLLSFDGEFYRVDTIYGALTLDGTGVTCAGVGCPNLETYVAEFSIAGARPMGEVLLPALVEMFARQSGMRVQRHVQDDTHYTYVLRLPDTGKPVVRITFRISNTDDGFADMLAGKADMVLAMREITANEAKTAHKAGLGDMKRAARSRIVALDGLVPVVAQNNPATEISLHDLARIFAGEIGNWQEIGGPDAPVYLHMRTADSGLAQQFVTDVMHSVSLDVVPTVARHPSAAGLVDAVAADPFAIGITRLSELGNAKLLAISGTCGMKFRATSQSIKTEDYPLTTPLFIYTPARRLPKIAREFLTYLRSGSAQHVVRQTGFVDQDVTQLGIGQQGGRFANAIASAGGETGLDELQRMVDVLRPAARLTITFRFEAGSTVLDAQSRSNVVLLARLLEAGIYDGRELMFVGFSDGVGDAGINLKIAKRRASATLVAVTKAATTLRPAQVSLGVEGFGEALPMACDDTEWGRQVNRRVEVWIK